MAKRAHTDFDFRGDLQTETMHTLWKLGEATVDEVREGQPPRRKSAYNTVQTVLNRLVERGLLQRQRRGRAFVYRPEVAESEFLTRSIGDRLAGASPDARRIALINLVEDLEPGEVDEIARRAALGGSGRVSRRLDYLEGIGAPAGPRLEHAVRALASALVLITLGLLAAVPGWALAASSAHHPMSTADSSCPKESH